MESKNIFNVCLTAFYACQFTIQHTERRNDYSVLPFDLQTIFPKLPKTVSKIRKLGTKKPFAGRDAHSKWFWVRGIERRFTSYR